MKTFLWMVLFAAVAFALRGHNLRDTFVGGQIYFVDADCYSRMTRARMVDAQPGLVIRKHEFENYPQGVVSHTTAPLDYLIVALKRGLDPLVGRSSAFRESAVATQSLDVAGALISPLLGAITCGFLVFWARGEPAWRRGRVWMTAPALFAISGIVVHGTLLGRPDHQGVLILLLCVTVGAEWRLWRSGEQNGRVPTGWAVTSGIAWGLAVWVSLYEPLILFVTTLVVGVVLYRRAYIQRLRMVALGLFCLVLIVAVTVEGWRSPFPSDEVRNAFATWSRTIGELRHMELSTASAWLGWFWIAAAVLLWKAGKTDRRARAALVLVAALFALSCWQQRWGYFLAAIFAMSLPWQLGAAPKPWLGWLAFTLSLWPVAREWDVRLTAAERNGGLHRAQLTQLRTIADQMRGHTVQPFLAPWWLSPPVAYWSGQPGIAGSSHQSLPGIVATARFYLAQNIVEGGRIVRERVGSARPPVWVIFSTQPANVTGNAASILDVTEPPMPLGRTAVEHPASPEPLLTEAYQEQFFRLYLLDENQLPE